MGHTVAQKFSQGVCPFVARLLLRLSGCSKMMKGNAELHCQGAEFMRFPLDQSRREADC